MTGEVPILPSLEVNQAIRKICAAQNLGRVASDLEHQAVTLRDSMKLLDLKPLEAPEGQFFKVTVTERERRLVIEPFIHRSCEWGDPYKATDSEYSAMVGCTAYENDSIKVDSIAFDENSSQIWGYNRLRRVRVLIDHDVNVFLKEEE